jgi:hypothetical protein
MKQTGKTDSKKLRVSLILFLALIVASCASTGRQEKKLEELLKLSVDAFNGAFRWEDYVQAAAFVPKDKEERFWAEVDKFKGKIRITDYEVREVEFKDERSSGTAILHFQYWRPASPTLESVTFTQKWYYSEKDKLWKVSDSGFGAITKTRAGF